MQKTNYIVAIVGRPNTGKSTLFNKLIGESRAILSDVPGTTRDILYGNTAWNKVDFTLADTAGIELDKKSPLEKDILLQTKSAAQNADLIVFLVDARTGLNPDDQKAADIIRKLNKQVVLAVNKAESVKFDATAPEFYKLGLGEPMLISGIQGRGLGDLLDNISEKLKKIKKKSIKETKSDIPIIRVAIVGRPNTGKSTLFNKLIGQNRSRVSEIAGTTRDAINETIETKDAIIEMIDTAGLRRRGKIEVGIEKFSSLHVLRSLHNADIALLLIEGPEGVIAQDLHIAQIVLEAGKGLILVVNKWDAVEKSESITNDYEKYLKQKTIFMPWVPHLYLSALTGQRVDKIIDMVKTVWDSLNTRIPTKQLNTIVRDAYVTQPPRGRGKPPKVYFASQRNVNPPTILLKVNFPEQIHFTYLRYLEKLIRKTYPLIGSPLNWKVIKSSTK